jgi:hypothetical protein
MKASDCLVCQRQRGTEISAYVLAADPLAHHHHVVACAGCGLAWYEDIVIGAFGPVAARRDTLPCSCPPARWRRAVMFALAPERDCRCGAELLDAEGAAA